MITPDDFNKIDVPAGTIIKFEPFPESKKQTIKLWIDLRSLGIKKSSPQITALYTPSEINKQASDMRC